jgi:hypothetical protein
MKTAFTYVLVVCLSVAGALALWIVPQALYDPPRTPYDVSLFLEENPVVQSDSRVGFVIRPNISVIAFAGKVAYPVHTDGRSARVDAPGKQSPGQVDIITVGCSVSWGDGVENQDTFTSIVARKLGLTAANLSWSSFSGLQAAERITSNIDLKPKYIIYGFFEQHLDRNVRPCSEIRSPICLRRPYITFANGPRTVPALADQSDSLAEIRRWYRATAQSTDAFRSRWTDIYWTGREKIRQVLTVLEKSADPTDAEKITAQLIVLERMKRQASELGARLIIAYIPLYFTDVKDPADAFVHFAQEQGATLVNLAPALRSMKAAGRTIGIPGDGHPTSETHAAFATEILKAVRSLSGFARPNEETHSPSDAP